jgi:6-phosphofructokinase 1
MVKKIGILTGGGDAPGLNAVIYSFVKSVLNNPGGSKYEIIGYLFGYKGLYNNEFIPLDLKSTSGILHRGGTILYSSNKDNLFDYYVKENGVTVKKDVSDQAIENMKKEGVEVLVGLGGDGTLTSIRDFGRKGVKVIGIPKTIDNDLGATEITFGFDTAVNIVTENLGRIHTTAESHRRVMIVEVMGRNAGWIPLYSGIAGSADVILLPEYPYEVNKIVQKINERNAAGKPFTIIVIGEGAREQGKSAAIGEIIPDSPDPVRYGGAGARLAGVLKGLVENEIRSVSLGHIQRGGETSPRDRILSARYGIAAARLIEQKRFGEMVCLRDGKMDGASLEEVVGANKYVTGDHELVCVARKLGISFGCEEIESHCFEEALTL